MVSRPQVKICGVRSAEEAVLAASLGADLLGLNFHPPSPRCLSVAEAKTITAAVHALPKRPLLVGVFVHPSPAEAAALGEELGLDLLQLHGNHQPAAVAPYADKVLAALATGKPVAPVAPPRRVVGKEEVCEKLMRLIVGASGGLGSSPIDQVSGAFRG